MDDVADANLGRTVIFNNMVSFLERFDVLACPTVGCMPHPQSAEWVTEIAGQRLDGYMDWLRFAFLGDDDRTSGHIRAGRAGATRPADRDPADRQAARRSCASGGGSRRSIRSSAAKNAWRPAVAQSGEAFVTWFPSSSKLCGASQAPESSVTCGPFAVENREPGRIAIMPLDHRGLPEDAFEGESQPRRRGHGARVQIVAFPFIAPIAPVDEHLTHHQIHRLGGGRASLQRWREIDMSDFDHAVRRINAPCRPDGRMRCR